jgi:flagellar L-ring protein precursor FlgH
MKRFQRTALGALLIIGTLCGMAAAVSADSLWPEQAGSIYAKKAKGYKAGDLLTVIVVEQAQATQRAATNSDENGSVSAGGSGKLDFIPQLGANWDSESSGAGTTTRGGSLSARLTVQIKEITPEGLLVVEGQQSIKVNKENQLLKIRGKIRPEDVSSSNTVLSSVIADASIEYQGTGTVGETQGTGVLTRFFHWLF